MCVVLTPSSWPGKCVITFEFDGTSVWYRIHQSVHKATSGQAIGVEGLLHIVLRGGRPNSRLVSVIKISVCV